MTENLDRIGQEALAYLSLKNSAREKALPRSRHAIRCCANGIRAAHRHEFEAAEQLIAQAGSLLAEMRADLRDHPDIFFAGFVQDAQKEYAEAVTFIALVQQRPLPTIQSLEIDWAPYLNGLGEAVGETRRYLLDQLRRAQFEDCERLLQTMDSIYALLTTIDFPDAITAGLRRTTDATRGILEKTRGDLTIAAGQFQLQRSMQDLKAALQAHNTQKT